MGPSPSDEDRNDEQGSVRREVLEPGPGPGENPYVDGETAAERVAGSGPLFDDVYRPGETNTEAGLIAGEAADQILVAGVGYPLLADLAVGTVVAYRVAEWDLPEVAVADCSHTPIAAAQTLTEGDFETLLLVGAEKRGGELNDGTPSENPGAIHEYGPDAFDAADAELVERIGESAMGSNTVENVVIVSRAISDLPDDTRIFTVEPGYDSWGLTVGEFTEPVEGVFDDLLDRVLAELDDARGGVEP